MWKAEFYNSTALILECYFVDFDEISYFLSYCKDLDIDCHIEISYNKNCKV